MVRASTRTAITESEGRPVYRGSVSLAKEQKKWEQCWERDRGIAILGERSSDKLVTQV